MMVYPSARPFSFIVYVPNNALPTSHILQFEDFLKNICKLFSYLYFLFPIIWSLDFMN